MVLSQKRSLSLLLIFFIPFIFSSCKDSETKEDQAAVENAQKKTVPEDLKWSERMMMSEMHRFPEASKLDFREEPKWSYTNGLVLKAAQEVYEETNKKEYYDYIYDFADTLITGDGNIRTYKLSDQNLDMLNSGNVLL